MHALSIQLKVSSVVTSNVYAHYVSLSKIANMVLFPQ